MVNEGHEIKGFFYGALCALERERERERESLSLFECKEEKEWKGDKHGIMRSMQILALRR